MLSEKQITELQKPFDFKEHGFFQKNPYILKSAIRNRLNRHAPGWMLLPPELVANDENVIVMRGGIQIGDIRRYAVGTGVILRANSDGVAFDGAKLAGMVSKAYKQATSDILPRAALEFGIGEYLKNKPKTINQDNFAGWLAELTRTPADPNLWAVENILAWGNKWRATGLTDNHLMKALNITEKWTDFRGTVAEADKAIEAYRSLQSSFPSVAAVDLKKLYGTRTILECDTKYLAPGDILIRRSPSGGITYEEVTSIPVRGTGTFPWSLTIKHLETGESETLQLGGIAYNTLAGGPKVKAYMDNPRLGHEPAHGVTPKWNPLPADADVAPIVGALPVVICKTSQLEPGDVFKQSPRNDKGYQQALFKVITKPEKRSTSIWLTTKNYATGKTEMNGWSDSDKEVIAGPKCQAYAKDHSVCEEGNGSPRWPAEAAKV